MSQYYKFVIFALLIPILSACGGGGGGSSAGDGGNSSGGNTPDTTPNAFSFIDQTGVARNSTIESNPITVSGINAPASISISSNGEFSINGGTYTNITGTVTNGDNLTVRQTSSPNFSETISSTLTIGGISDSFDVTTESDTQPPTVKLTFPSSNALMDSSSLTVVGTANDDSLITNISINGVDASTDNSFLNWRATIPIGNGINNITVVSEDVFSNVNSSAVQFTVTNFGPQLGSVSSLLFDSDNDRIIVSNSRITGSVLVSVDPESGQRSLFSDLGVDLDTIAGSNNLRFIVDMTEYGDQILASDNGQDAIISIDKSSGDMTVISDAANGAGPNFEAPQGISLVPSSSQALAIDAVLDALFSVDLTPGPTLGNRTIISDTTLGMGPSISAAKYVAYNPTTNSALVTELTSNPSIISVNLSNGDRVTVSNSATGTGPNPGSIVSIDYDDASNSAFVGDGNLSSIFSVDFSSGNADRVIISSDAIGTGPKLSLGFSSGIAWDSIRNRVIVSDYNLSTLVSVNPQTGDRTILSDGVKIGLGGNMNTYGVEYDAQNDRALVYSNSNLGASLLAVNLSTGARTTLASSGGLSATGSIALDANNNRVLVPALNDDAIVAYYTNGVVSIISGPAIGSGPNLALPFGIAVDSVNNWAFVCDAGLDAILSINLTTGDRTIISDASNGSGPNFSEPRGITYDKTMNRLLVTEPSSNAIIAVALNTGNRTILSDAGTGTGVNLFNPTDIEIDMANNRALVYDHFPGSIVAVDLSTGNRTIVSNGTTGQGPEFDLVEGIALQENGNILVADVRLDALFQVEPVSGDRVIISK